MPPTRGGVLVVVWGLTLCNGGSPRTRTGLVWKSTFLHKEEIMGLEQPDDAFGDALHGPAAHERAEATRIPRVAARSSSRQEELESRDVDPNGKGLDLFGIPMMRTPFIGEE